LLCNVALILAGHHSVDLKFLQLELMSLGMVYNVSKLERSIVSAVYINVGDIIAVLVHTQEQGNV
jgi:hypothetical protein